MTFGTGGALMQAYRVALMLLCTSVPPVSRLCERSRGEVYLFIQPLSCPTKVKFWPLQEASGLIL